jgi:hypothetical protein
LAGSNQMNPSTACAMAVWPLSANTVLLILALRTPLPLFKIETWSTATMPVDFETVWLVTLISATIGFAAARTPAAFRVDGVNRVSSCST